MRTINKLSAALVAKATEPGLYGDGGGLWLQVSPSGARSWLFRFMLDRKARAMGLGSLNTFSLKEARERAREARQMVADGKDPIEVRNAARATTKADDAKRITFAEAAERYIKAHRASWKNPKHIAQWSSTLKTYAMPVIGDLSVASIETAHIQNVLDPIWEEKNETASRVRGRMESVLDWATVRGYRQGDNPARWKGHIEKVLASRAKVAKVKHHPAMPYGEIAGFMPRLRGKDYVSARALEFTILTAARTGEVIGAQWPEFDLVGKVWTIPGERMKSSRDHRVPLSPRVIEILENLPREQDNNYVFPGGKRAAGLSNAAMSEALKGLGILPAVATVHGFRSTFRDWAAELTNFPRDVAEAALAHVVADKTEAAYRRGDALAKRRKLMEAWAGFCAERRSEGNVLPIGGRATA